MKEDITISQTPLVPYLTAKPRIGTCKGPINYRLNQTSFHRSEISDAKKKRVDEVHDCLKSKILSKSNTWEKSTAHLSPVVKSRSMENHVKDRSNAYQYNYRSESLDPLRIQEPIDMPTKFHISRTSSSSLKLNQTRQMNDFLQQGKFRRTEELPVNLRLLDKLEWNSLTSISIKDKDKKLESMTKTSKAFTNKVSRSFSKEDHIGPLQSQKLYANSLRKDKSEGTFVPASRYLEDTTVINNGVRNEIAVEKQRGYVTSHHSGVWELNKAENK
jgi:hypothetical protein